MRFPTTPSGLPGPKIPPACPADLSVSHYPQRLARPQNPAGLSGGSCGFPLSPRGLPGGSFGFSLSPRGLPGGSFGFSLQSRPQERAGSILRAGWMCVILRVLFHGESASGRGVGVEVWAAIDLRGGKCVRLRQGDYAQETVFGDDPAAMARNWIEQGGRRLHLVDLDAAKDGSSANLASICAIVGAVGVPCELGGGVRSEEKIAELLAIGWRGWLSAPRVEGSGLVPPDGQAISWQARTGDRRPGWDGCHRRVA